MNNSLEIYFRCKKILIQFKKRYQNKLQFSFYIPTHSNFLMISFIIFAYDDNIGSDLLLFYTYQHNF